MKVDTKRHIPAYFDLSLIIFLIGHTKSQKLEDIVAKGHAASDIKNKVDRICKDTLRDRYRRSAIDVGNKSARLEWKRASYIAEYTQKRINASKSE